MSSVLALLDHDPAALIVITTRQMAVPARSADMEHHP
jgi:hypothetical protein